MRQTSTSRQHSLPPSPTDPQGRAAKDDNRTIGRAHTAKEAEWEDRMVRAPTWSGSAYVSLGLRTNSVNS